MSLPQLSIIFIQNEFTTLTLTNILCINDTTLRANLIPRHLRRLYQKAVRSRAGRKLTTDHGDDGHLLRLLYFLFLSSSSGGGGTGLPIVKSPLPLLRLGGINRLDVCRTYPAWQHALDANSSEFCRATRSTARQHYSMHAMQGGCSNIFSASQLLLAQTGGSHEVDAETEGIGITALAA